VSFRIFQPGKLLTACRSSFAVFASSHLPGNGRPPLLTNPSALAAALMAGIKAGAIRIATTSQSRALGWFTCVIAIVKPEKKKRPSSNAGLHQMTAAFC
jgi:hypothetical protein